MKKKNEYVVRAGPFIKDLSGMILCDCLVLVLTLLMPHTSLAVTKSSNKLIPNHHISVAFSKNPIKSNETAKLIVTWRPVKENPELKITSISIVDVGFAIENTENLSPSSICFTLKGFDTGCHKVALRAEVQPSESHSWLPTKIIFFSPELTVESLWSVPKPWPEFLGFAVVIFSAVIGGFWSYWKEIRAKKKAADLERLKNDYVLLNFFSNELLKNKSIVYKKEPEYLKKMFYSQYIRDRALPKETYWVPDYSQLDQYYGHVRKYNLKLSDPVTSEVVNNLQKDNPDLIKKLKKFIINMEYEYEKWRRRLDGKLREAKRIL